MIFNPRIGLSISSLSCKIVPSGGYNSHSDRVKSLLRHVTNESPSQLSITNYNVELSPVANKKQTPSLSKKDNRYLLSKEKKRTGTCYMAKNTGCFYIQRMF